MALPYQITEAIQTPRIAFSNDPWLKSASVELNANGLPRPRAGNFAVTFQLQNDGERRAIRCFTRVPPDAATRYAAIDGFLAGYKGRLLVPSSYRPQGMLVEGRWTPITSMPWILGSLIWDYAIGHLSKPEALLALRDEVLAANGELESFGAAHGDLQHGNVLVTSGGRIRLVDYDGMFVPALGGRLASEIGHSNYQHPARDEMYFDATLDRFSVLVIATALQALAVQPALWRQFATSESLLFRRSDFDKPDDSDLFRELASIKGVATAADALRRAISITPSKIPEVGPLLRGEASIGANAFAVPESARRADSVLDASDPGLWQLAGRQVRLVGRAREVDSLSLDALIFAHHHSSGAWTPSLRLVIPPVVRSEIHRYGRELPSFGKWLEISGVIENWGRVATVHITHATDVAVLSPLEASRELAGRVTIRQWLGLDPRAEDVTRPTPSPRAPRSRTAGAKVSKAVVKATAVQPVPATSQISSATSLAGDGESTGNDAPPFDIVRPSLDEALDRIYRSREAQAPVAAPALPPQGAPTPGQAWSAWTTNRVGTILTAAIMIIGVIAILISFLNR